MHARRGHRLSAAVSLPSADHASRVKIGDLGRERWRPILRAGLVACSQSYASRVDDRTFRIEGPEVPGGSDAPNRRLADKLCPRGYRVLEESRRKPDPNSQIQTFWTVRCL